MIPSVPSTAPRSEAEDIESLRQRYEDRGFTFVVHPPTEMVPSFLAPFEPDAIAQAPGKNIVVEVKLQQTDHPGRSVADLRRRFAGHPDWTLDVVYLLAGRSRQISIPPAEVSSLRRFADEAIALSATGHTRAAFLLAWSLLEASLNTTSGKDGSAPRTSGQIVQWLAMNGHIEPEAEPRLRALADLRNRLAHGDLSLDARADDVDYVLGTVDDLLVNEAA